MFVSATAPAQVDVLGNKHAHLFFMRRAPHAECIGGKGTGWAWSRASEGEWGAQEGPHSASWSGWAAARLWREHAQAGVCWPLQEARLSRDPELQRTVGRRFSSEASSDNGSCQQGFDQVCWVCFPISQRSCDIKFRTCICNM